MNENQERPGTVPEGLRRLRAVTSTELAAPRVAAIREDAGDGDSPLADPAERALVDRARAGEAEAFAQLVAEHQHTIFRLAMRALHCDRATAEDVCQDVFLRAWRGLGRFGGEIKFGVWLHKIAMNACISEYRRRHTLKRGSHRTLSLDAPLSGQDGDTLHHEPTSDEVDPGRRAVDREFAVRVREAVGRLPDDFRDAVVLRDMQGLSYEEIGDVLGLPPGTVRSRIHRGRLILQDLLRGFEA